MLSKRIEPVVGTCSVATDRISVDLPAPFGPSSPNMPGGTSRFTESSARVPFGYVCERFSILSMTPPRESDSSVHDRQHDGRRLRLRAQDGDLGLAIIRRLRVEDVRHERLRIAVVQREQCRLDLHHDPMSRLKDVVHVRQLEADLYRLVRRDRARVLEALAVAA